MKDTSRRATTLEEAIAELERTTKELNKAIAEFRGDNPFMDWSTWDALEENGPDPMDLTVEGWFGVDKIVTPEASQFHAKAIREDS